MAASSNHPPNKKKALPQSPSLVLIGTAASKGKEHKSLCWCLRSVDPDGYKNNRDDGLQLPVKSSQQHWAKKNSIKQ